MLELYGSGDPATLKLVICLEELGLDYRFHPLDLKRLAQWSPAHRKLAPQGEVPVLVDDEHVMADAALALLYLAEANPSPKLLPSNLVDRYDVQALDDVFDAALLGAVNLLGWHRHNPPEVRAAFDEALAQIPGRQSLAGWRAEPDEAEVDRLTRAEGTVAAGVANIEKTLGERQWLVANSLSIADISAFAVIEGLSVMMPAWVDAARVPRVCAWLDRIRSRPAVRGALHGAGRVEGAAVYAPPQSH